MWIHILSIVGKHLDEALASNPNLKKVSQTPLHSCFGEIALDKFLATRLYSDNY